MAILILDQRTMEDAARLISATVAQCRDDSEAKENVPHRVVHAIRSLVPDQYALKARIIKYDRIKIGGCWIEGHWSLLVQATNRVSNATVDFTAVTIKNPWWTTHVAQKTRFPI